MNGVGGVDRVYIRYLGNGCLWFRSYSGSLLKGACTDRTHGGHMCGDMVDTLWSVIRLIYVNSPQKVMAEVDVK